MARQRKSSDLLERLIRRVMREQTDRAHTLLSSPVPFDATAIHETRKAVKRLRAALSLVREELGPRYRDWISRLRAVNRCLSSVRDLDACRKILGDLRPACSSSQQAVLEQLQVELTQQRTACADACGEDSWPAMVAELDAVHEGFTGWQNSTDGFELVRPALRQMSRRSRRLIRRLREEVDVESIHALRKLVKWRLYWLEFLQPIWPRGLAAELRLVDSLADKLGDHHDLAVLLQWVQHSATAQKASQAQSVESLQRRLQSQQKKLERRALKLARYLFAERPKAFARRWKVLWKIWRDAPQPVGQSSSAADPPPRPRPR
jgi:CHAD domain-containing protein